MTTKPTRSTVLVRTEKTATVLCEAPTAHQHSCSRRTSSCAGDPPAHHHGTRTTRLVSTTRSARGAAVAIAQLCLSRQAAAAAAAAAGALRILLLDLPLILLLTLYASSTWIGHVHRHYLTPQLHHAAMWNNKRQENEITYFARTCQPQDISTTNHGAAAADLFLSKSSTTNATTTADEAYQHQRQHGFTVFRNVMRVETATNLRNYIASKNYNLTKEESIYVIEWENRYSFGLGTEEPSVAAALKELLNHQPLKEAVTMTYGGGGGAPADDAAILEMTAITIAYGAIPQWWHPDVQATASATRHARSFDPSFSLFVPLQDTTAAMGATGVCPGTHYCNAGDSNIAAICEEHGFQLVEEETGVWKAGDALLMNTASYHRGGGHTDPNAPDRVMLLLTFSSPRPASSWMVDSSRQLSRGITFSLRWDMWGHTWGDLARAADDTAMMTQPWTTLRALGLYKPPDAPAWGVDFVTGAMTRMSYEGYGFHDDAMGELKERLGAIPFLPSYLHGDMDLSDDLTCHKFLVSTANKVHAFLGIIIMLALFEYFAIVIVLSTLAPRNTFGPFFLNMCRLGVLCGSVYFAFILARRHVDSTQWARDIRMGRRYASVMENEEDFLVPVSGVTTLPTRYDVLIENRFGPKDFNMYDDYINGHFGNRQLLAMVKQMSSTYAAYPKMFRNATARYIVESVGMNHGRFLEQGLSGRWQWVDVKRALHFTKKELARGAVPAIAAMTGSIRHAIADYRFGIYRNSALASKHMVPFLRDFEKRVVLRRDMSTPTRPERPLAHPQATAPLKASDGVTVLDWNSPVKAPIVPIFKQSSYLSQRRINAFSDSMRTPTVKLVPTEPSRGAWTSAGSVVEGRDGDHWYTAIVDLVTAHGRYYVHYEDDGNSDYLDFDGDEIRPFVEHQPGDRPSVSNENEDHHERCTIIDKTNDGLYKIVLEESGQYIENVHRKRFRRDRGEVHEKHVGQDYFD
jgi:hypothetical protein